MSIRRKRAGAANVLYKDEDEEDGKTLKTKRRQEKVRKLKISKGGRARGDSREETSSVTSTQL